MTRLRATTHLLPGTQLAYARAAGDALVAWGADGVLHAVRTDATPHVAWQTADVRAATLGAEHAFCVEGDEGAWRAVARALDDGRARWSRDLEVKSASRIFTSAAGKVFCSVARDGRFLLAELRASDGELLRHHDIDRRRVVVSDDGLACWTRDRQGVSWLHLVTDERRSHRVAREGAMTARGTWLFMVAGATLVGLQSGRERWRRTLPERDLTEVARDDGLDDDGEPDRWAAQPGRPACDDTAVYVADLNGALHAFEHTTGTPIFSVATRHYPSSQKAAMPAICGAYVLFAGSDETLYLLGRDGQTLDALELPEPFEGEVCALDGSRAVLPGDGLRFIGVED